MSFLISESIETVEGLIQVGSFPLAIIEALLLPFHSKSTSARGSASSTGSLLSFSASTALASF